MSERSQILVSAKQHQTDSVQVETYHLKTEDLGVYTDLLSCRGHRSAPKAANGLQTVNSQLRQEEERERASIMVSSLSDDTVNKLETAGTKISRKTLLRENVPSNYDSSIIYDAGKPVEVKTILKEHSIDKSKTFLSEMNPKQRWLQSNKIKTATSKTVHFKLPNIFEDNTDSRERMIYNNSGKYGTLFEKDPLCSKVKEFLQKPQPTASEPSLRIKKYPDAKLPMDGEQLGNNHSTSKNADLPGKGMGVPINNNTCPLMSHFKDRKWYYQDKTGKCRYLRVPESPIPPISYVFADDD